MREILFRAKAINRDKSYHRTNYKNGDWVYGLITRLYDERFKNLPAEMTNENGISRIEIDHNTIGQYTGLNDKNDKKIFEGDIIKPYEDDKCYVVKYFDDNNYPAFDCVPEVPLCEYNGLWFLVDMVGCEVIGNIHENKILPKENGLIIDEENECFYILLEE